MLKKERGITLIALIVTIIVIIIVAGITISAITGNKGIVNQAEISKNKSERQEIIENAKTEVTNVVMENVGTDLTRSQLKEILDKYFDNVPDDYTLDTELTTKSEYGNYKIKVSEIYDRTAVLADNSNDTTTPVNTSSTNTGNTTNSSGNTSNDSNSNGSSSSVNNSTSTSNTLSSETTEGSENNNTNQGQTNSTREPEEINTTGVKLDNKSIVLDLNGEKTIKLNATPTPSNANKNTTMKWTSKKKKVATVTQNGTVTGKAVGNSTIMASTPNGKSAECLAVCQAKITGITINPVNASIQIGETIQLTAEATPSTVTEKITWKTNNEDVAKVNRNGIVTAVGNGKTIIIAQNPSGTIKATCTVTVTSGENKLMLAYTEEEKNTIDEYFKYMEKELNGEEFTEEENNKMEELNGKIEKMSTTPYLRGTIAREKIESIKFKKGEVPANGIIEQFDASESENGSIIGYYTDEDNNGLYELTIISQNEIITNKDSSMVFSSQKNLKDIDFENLVFKDVTNTKFMFFDCGSLISLDLSKLDTSKVTDMSLMFFSCSNLTTLDLSNFNTSQVTNMSWMFAGCNNLTSLDLSNFDTSQATDMSMMFIACMNLTRLDLSKFNTSQVTNMMGMFASCESLKTIYVSKYDETTNKGWTTKNVTNSDMMFSETSKIVGGNRTKYDSNYIDATYARIDKTGIPGYLTDIDFYTEVPEENRLMLANTFTEDEKKTLDEVVQAVENYKFLKDNGDLYDLGEYYTKLKESLEKLDEINSKIEKILTMSYLRGTIPRGAIESIKFKRGQVPTSGVIEQFDASAGEDGSIIGYYTDEDNNELYELTIISDYEIIANNDSSMLFAWMPSLKNIDFENLNFKDATNMKGMFYECSSLTSLDMSEIDTSKVTDMGDMFYGCSVLGSLDLRGLVTNKVTDMSQMFYECNSLISLDVSRFDTSQVMNMNKMFYNCTNLTSLNLNGLNTSKVTDMSYMFYNCTNLTSLDVSKLDTSRVTSMKIMFGGCTNLTSLDVKGLNTSQVIDMSMMFYNCTNLTSLNLNGLNTSQLINMRSMFCKCDNLTSLDLGYIDTSQVTDMSKIFYKCSSLTSINLNNFNTSKVKDMYGMFGNCKGLTSLEVSNFDTSQVTKMGWMFYDCTNLPTLDVSNFNTSQVTDMNNMFYYCDNLTSLDVSDFDTNKVTYMSGMFEGCSSLTTLDVSNFDTSQVTDMNSMFKNCSSLTSLDVNKFDTSQVTDMMNMFDKCSSLTSLDVSNFDTSQVKRMRFMFGTCSRLSNIDVSNFNTSQVTDMMYMFYKCSSLTSLDLSNFDTSQVKEICDIFYGCSSLISLNLSNFNTSQVTDMTYMFYGCSSLTSLDVSNFDTSQVTNMEKMFYECNSLTSLDLSNFNTSQVTNMDSMFWKCSSLTTIYVSKYDETTDKGWTVKNVEHSFGMFYEAVKLVGGNGTKYNSSNKDDETYARIDEAGQLGYLTDITKKGIRLDKYNIILDMSGNKTAKLTATISQDISNKNSKITWTTSDSTKVQVDQEGNITAKAITTSNNAVTITATTSSGYNASCLVVVKSSITSISVSPTSGNMEVNQTLQLTLVIDPKTTTEKITWKSRNKDVAKVDNNGKVTAIGNGKVEIVAQNPSGTIKAICTVTVGIDTTKKKIQVDIPYNVTYNGDEQKWIPNVTDDTGKILVENTDYIINYNTTNFIDSGNIEVTIIGKGIYIGTITRSYTIEKATLKITTSSASKPYNGSALTSSGIIIEGIINNEIVTIRTTGSQTEVGASVNTYEMELKPGKEENYNLIEDLGTLTVTEAIAPEPPTITPDYNEELGTIEINVNLSSIDENMESTNSSELINSIIESEKFNVGIFLDEDGTILAFEDYNKEIKFENSNSTTVSYNNIPEGTYYIFALDEDGNPINVSSFWTGNTNYMLCYNFGTDMNETNSVTVKSKSKQQVVLNYVVTIVPDGS